jgi:ribosome-binding ATPase YchF (GTP1/OBG family)
MQIGLVGKPNVGKSTFFGAATMAPVEIANYPFTTIAANKGVAFVRSKCACKELGVTCDPRSSACVDGVRLIPIELLDVAGLVPDAWQGKGLGNQFLDDLRQADALINIIDVSGSTDIEGVYSKPGNNDPMQDIGFLLDEIDHWICSIIDKGFDRIARQAHLQGMKIEAALHERLAGLQITETQIASALRDLHLPENPTQYTEENLLDIARAVRAISKPMIVAMNKADIAPAENLEKVSAACRISVPTMAETELALKKAEKAGLLSYVPGDPDFQVKEGVQLNDGQSKALDYMRQNMQTHQGTGVQQCLEAATFQLLDLITVFPVEDENKYTDHDGRVLPDAFLVPRGSTARQLAYRVHTDLGDNFIRAVNARSKRTVGHDYVLQDGDVIKIVSRR